MEQLARGCRYGNRCRYIHSNPTPKPYKKSKNKRKRNKKRNYAEIELNSPPILTPQIHIPQAINLTPSPPHPINQQLAMQDYESMQNDLRYLANNYLNTNSLEPKLKRQRIDNHLSSPSKLQVDENVVIGPTCLWGNPLAGKDLEHDVIEIETLNPHNKAQLIIFDVFCVQFFALETPELQSAQILNLQKFNAVSGKTYRYLANVLPEHNVNEDCIQLTIPIKNECKMYRVKFHHIENHPYTMSIGYGLMNALGLVFGRK